MRMVWNIFDETLLLDMKTKHLIFSSVNVAQSLNGYECASSLLVKS